MLNTLDISDNNLEVRVHGLDILDAFHPFQATQFAGVQTA